MCVCAQGSEGKINESFCHLHCLANPANHLFTFLNLLKNSLQNYHPVPEAKPTRAGTRGRHIRSPPWAPSATHPQPATINTASIY